MKRPFSSSWHRRKKSAEPLVRRHSTHTIVRIMSKQGICSRKEAVRLVLEGKVTVNGEVISTPGKIIKKDARIHVEGIGKSAVVAQKKYLMFHKPCGIITTRKDEKDRETVYAYLPQEPWLSPVGRLDKESEGLLLFTNDTAWGEFMTNPKSKVIRVYEVTVKAVVSDEECRLWQKGVDIGRGEQCTPVECKVMRRTQDETLLLISLYEGKNREIRRLIRAAGKEVMRLKRIAYGPYTLGDLAVGKYSWISARLSGKKAKGKRLKAKGTKAQRHRGTEAEEL